VRATPMPSADGIHFCFFNRTNTEATPGKKPGRMYGIHRENCFSTEYSSYDR
jgi:hypothetical protein